MIELIDQSDPTELRFQCMTCEAVIVKRPPSHEGLDQHKCNPEAIAAVEARAKARAAAPAPKAPRAKRPRRPSPAVVPEPEPTPAPRKRGRPRNAAEIPA